MSFWVLLSASFLVACAGGRSPVWSDEFDGLAGESPSASKWSLEEGDGTSQGIPGWGNRELQYYVREAARLDGAGHLVVTAASTGADRRRCYYGPCRFTSARLVSRFRGRYGRFEARLRTTAAAGTWPAFWMLGADVADAGWPACGEIDVMEARGSRPDTVSGAAHGPGYSGGRALAHSRRMNGSFADGFHVVAVDWWPGSLAWSVDGVVYGTERPRDGMRWVFDRPFFMLLNLAVGGHFGGQPDGTANFTDAFVVDYVRVYALVDNCTVEAERLGGNATRDSGRGGAAPAAGLRWAAWIVVGMAGLGNRILY